MSLHSRSLSLAVTPRIILRSRASPNPSASTRCSRSITNSRCIPDSQTERHRVSSSPDYWTSNHAKTKTNIPRIS
ncbi:hypothetical protein B0H12DRAFT_1126765 [Mycena haematopus]|nr:hypothetical protein B0H12DRAFT_1126765 [Mycena haematopus]